MSAQHQLIPASSSTSYHTPKSYKPQSKLDIDEEIELTSEQVIARILAANSYYERLGVTKEADLKTIKRQYRKLVLHVHPDKNSSPEAQKAFVVLHEAFICLSDPIKKEFYDTCPQNEAIDFEEAKKSVLGILLELQKMGFVIPAEEKLEDFAGYIVLMSHNDEIKSLFNGITNLSLFATGLGSFFLGAPFLLHCTIVALGPLVIGPAIMWEELLAKFEGKTVASKLFSFEGLKTMFSITRSSVILTALWTTALGSLAIASSWNLITYVTNIVAYRSVEELDEWLLTDIYENDCTFEDTSSFSPKGEPINEEKSWEVVKIHDDDEDCSFSTYKIVESEL